MTDSPEVPSRSAERRSSVIWVIAIVGILLVLARLPLEDGHPSAKLNATLVVAAVGALLLVVMAISAPDLTTSDRTRVGLLAVMATAGLVTADIGVALGGRVATPLIAALALMLWNWWRGGR